jgi:hypothetical protein
MENKKLSKSALSFLLQTRVIRHAFGRGGYLLMQRVNRIATSLSFVKRQSFIAN